MSKDRKINASLVKDLRDKTGASIMECKSALEKSDGDIEKAIVYLRQKGKEKAGKKSTRATGEGIVAAYIHSNKRIGAMIELRSETDFVAKNSEFQELAYDLAMHIAAMSPKYLSFEQVSAKEREEFEHLVREELASEKKPAEIVEKIVEGKIKKHFEALSLLSQSFIKDQDMTVSDLIKEKISKIGENIQIGNFTRFEV
jgi:elongation factor Ts